MRNLGKTVEYLDTCTRFCGFTGKHPARLFTLSMVAFILQKQSWVTSRELIVAHRAENKHCLASAENVCQPLLLSIRILQRSLYFRYYHIKEFFSPSGSFLACFLLFLLILYG